MSYILIDNSTLTSVQRLTGDIEVSNKKEYDTKSNSQRDTLLPVLMSGEVRV